MADNTGIKEFAGEELSELADEVIFYDDFPDGVQAVTERIRDADAVLVSWNTGIGAEILSQCRALEYIGLCCTFFGEKSCNVDAAYCREKGIEVRGVSHYGDYGVVEYVFSELIRMVKGLGSISFYPEQRELRGMKLGIIGLGTVGAMIADTGAFFGMDVSYHNRREKPDCPYTYKDKETLLRESDVILTSIPRNQTVVENDDFAGLDTHKIFINVGVGPSFGQTGFEQWIERGGYAILDYGSVYDERRDWYGAQERISLSGRVAGFTCNARMRLAEKAVNNIKDYLTSVY